LHPVVPGAKLYQLLQVFHSLLQALVLLLVILMLIPSTLVLADLGDELLLLQSLFHPLDHLQSPFLLHVLFDEIKRAVLSLASLQVKELLVQQGLLIPADLALLDGLVQFLKSVVVIQIEVGELRAKVLRIQLARVDIIVSLLYRLEQFLGDRILYCLSRARFVFLLYGGLRRLGDGFLWGQQSHAVQRDRAIPILNTFQLSLQQHHLLCFVYRCEVARHQSLEGAVELENAFVGNRRPIALKFDNFIHVGLRIYELLHFLKRDLRFGRSVILVLGENQVLLGKHLGQ